MNECLDLLDNINEVSLGKGIFMRAPNIPIPKDIEFADDKGVFGRFLGHKRSMTALEAASMFNTSLSNYIAKANILGLAQTMKDDTIRDYFEKVIHSLKEHTEDLNKRLH